jgi:hypothetical protein
MPQASYNTSCLPGEIHKVTALAYFTGARGIEGREIFKDDKDRKSFLERLALILEETLSSLMVESKSGQVVDMLTG